jgi:hypothetical protein
MARLAAFVVVAVMAVSASVSSQGREGQEQPYPRLPAPPVKAPPDTMAPDIPGVVRGGTAVHLIRDLFHSTEAPIAMPDGSLLFTEQDAGDGQLVKIDKDDKVSVFLTNTNRTIGLAYDTKGRLIGVQSNIPRVAVLAPTRMTLVDKVNGLPLVAPNDLVADKKGGIYFSDPLNSRFRPTPPSRTKQWIVYIRPDGKATPVSEEVERPKVSRSARTAACSTRPTDPRSTRSTYSPTARCVISGSSRCSKAAMPTA